MKYLSVCSGIEAATVAWHGLGWTPLAFSEIEPFPRAVLQHHYPDVPLHGDFTVLRDQPWIVDADILVGGTPCQAFSVAGLRNSLSDERGNLSLEFVRLADAIDTVRRDAGKPPAIIVWENVPGVLSVKDNAFGCFLSALAGDAAPYVPPRGKWTNAGVVDGPARTVAWRVLDAQYFGLPQRRRRVFVVASAGDGVDPAAVLLECEGLRRDTPPRRETGQAASGGAASGLDVSCTGALTAGFGKMGAPEIDAYTAGGILFQPSTEDGTGRGTPHVLAAVAFAQNTRDEVRLQGGDGQIAGALAAEPGMKQTTYVAQAVSLRGRDGGGTAELGGGDKPHVLAAVAVQASQSGIRINDTIGTLDANYGSRRHNGVMTNMAVRRLTARECERLQGFPDDYTLIPWKKKPADQCPDGPRYKALGNSMAVPCMRWIGERIQNAV